MIQILMETTLSSKQSMLRCRSSQCENQPRAQPPSSRPILVWNSQLTKKPIIRWVDCSSTSLIFPVNTLLSKNYFKSIASINSAQKCSPFYLKSQFFYRKVSRAFLHGVILIINRIISCDVNISRPQQGSNPNDSLFGTNNISLCL